MGECYSKYLESRESLKCYLKCKSNKTPEEREVRLTLRRKCCSQSRAAEANEECEVQLENESQCYLKRKANETLEEQQIPNVFSIQIKSSTRKGKCCLPFQSCITQSSPSLPRYSISS